MENIVKFSFPGLGIKGGEVNSVAFGGVMWYGVIIACGMLMAIAYASYRCKQAGIKVDDLIDIAIFTIFFGVLGARLYYWSLNMDKFENIWEVLGFGPNGLAGLAILGGVFAGGITVVIVCAVKKLNWRKLLDAVAPGVMIAQAMGRWGNFMNGEAYGAIVEEGHPLYFLRMGLISQNTMGDFGTTEMVYVHPCFLYESLWNVCGFIIINLLYKKKKFDGQIALYYFAWYGFGRMFIEGLRMDSMYFGKTGIRSNQLFAFLLFMLASALLIYGLVVTSKKEKKVALAAEAASCEEDEYEENETENG